MRDVLIRVWDQGYQSPHFRRSRFRPDGITFRITIACRQFPYSAAFTTNINWKKSRLEKFRMSYLRSTGFGGRYPAAIEELNTKIKTWQGTQQRMNLASTITDLRSKFQVTDRDIDRATP